LDLCRGGCHLPAGEVIWGGAADGVPRDGQRVGHIRGQDGERDGHADVIGTPAELGGDLGRGDDWTGRIGEGALEVRAVPFGTPS
jgi:hypothetical protein